MPDRFPISKSLKLALCLAAVALPGCAVNLPQAPASSPADPSGPAATTASLRPNLLATSHTYLSSHADDREEKAKLMNVKMKDGAMEHDMAGMSHQGHNMSSLPPTQNQKPDAAAPAGAVYYTCPMHPEIHEAKPGECPKCGMTLVKKSDTSEGAKR